MYEDLVKSLKICGTPALINEKCIAFHDGCCEAEPVCMYELMRKAADAIEELQGRAKVLEKIADKWCEAVPKWIPVTERLPNPTFAREWYLVALESGCVTTLGFERETMQWHITGSPVAYWMPIPDRPKEET